VGIQPKSSSRERHSRGGRVRVRDRWFGLEHQSDFSLFRRWSHREGKDAFGSEDLKNRFEANDAYAAWIEEGKPKAK
jgi:hypothetical protein